MGSNDKEISPHLSKTFHLSSKIKEINTKITSINNPKGSNQSEKNSCQNKLIVSNYMISLNKQD